MKNIDDIMPNGKSRKKHNQYNNAWARNNREKTSTYSRKWGRKRSAFVVSLKTGKSCMLCGETHPACLDFHHRDRNKKNKEIQRLARSTGRNEVVLKEVKKCDLICANCHRKIHYNEIVH